MIASLREAINGVHKAYVNGHCNGGSLSEVTLTSAILYITWYRHACTFLILQYTTHH
jgi:hypothetical protein